MSSPVDRADDPSGASFYAPASGRAARLADVSQAATDLAAMQGLDQRQGGEHEAPTPVAVDPLEAEAIRRLHARRSLDSDVPSAPPLRLRSRSRLATFARLGGIAIAAAIIALVVVGQIPMPDLLRPQATSRSIEPASTPPRPAAVRAAKRPDPVMIPRLIVRDLRGKQGEPAPLGVALEGRPDGVRVMLSGLAPGMTVSTGAAVDAAAWQVPAADLSNAWIIPPKEFVGRIEVTAELRLANNSVAQRQTIHLEWVGAAAAAPAAQQLEAAPQPEPARQQEAAHQPEPARQPEAARQPKAAPAHRQIDPEERAVLLQRGKDFIANGDLAAARVVLQRAAEAEDAEAALMLAATYDPAVLRKLGVIGFAPDVALARAWYEKAKALGSAEAPRRLEALASMAQ